MKNLLFLILIFSTQLSWSQTATEDLDRLYRANPALVTQANPDALRAEATRLLGPESGARIHAFVTSDLNAFNQTRGLAITRLRTSPPANLRRVVVSGQSVTGMMAAALAAQSGHRVSVYDLRMTQTREIQWSSRQSLVDMLATIDPALAERYKTEVAKDLSRGSLLIRQDGTIKELTPQAMQTPDPRRVPVTTFNMLAERAAGTVETQLFETMLYDYLARHPNVVQHKGKIEFGELNPQTNEHMVIEYEDVTPVGQREKVYREISRGYPITVIAEGAGSSSRGALGITSMEVGPARFQVAGVVHLDHGGEIATHHRAEAPGRMITGSMGTTGSNERWVVADIDPARITPAPSFGTDTNAEAYKTERSRLLDAEFRRIAELDMRMAPGSLANVRVSGAVEGSALQTFDLQQHLSTRATNGTNVLLLGDAVGNGHWSVGGGVHVGAITHGQRFKDYLSVVDTGGSPTIAAQAYDAAALEDSRTWIRHGTQYFYDNIPDEDIRKAFNEAVELHRQGKIPSLQRGLELQLPEGRSSTAVKSIRLRCADIALRVLGDI